MLQIHPPTDGVYPQCTNTPPILSQGIILITMISIGITLVSVPFKNKFLLMAGIGQKISSAMGHEALISVIMVQCQCTAIRIG